jgi:hypothetical protein
MGVMKAKKTWLGDGIFRQWLACWTSDVKAAEDREDCRTPRRCREFGGGAKGHPKLSLKQDVSRSPRFRFASEFIP